LTIFYEDMSVGKEFISGPRSLSKGEIDSFARLTGDLNRLHTDDSYAKNTIFRGRVAHGLLALSVALGLWYGMDLTRDSLVALLGINKVAFRAPVRPGDKLRLISKVLSRRPSGSRPEAGIVTLKDIVAGERGDTLLEFERVLLVKRKSKGAKHP
jgi:acyl dehydratase